MADGLERQHFATRVGSAVSAVRDAHEPVALRISQVQDFGEADGRRFSVFFDGPGETFLPQGIYRLRLDDDAADVFLVPIGQDQGRYQYEAAFNRDGS